ncbi:MAG: glutamyl-tRNA reductase, partial [Euryarchaeota archaeon]
MDDFVCIGLTHKEAEVERLERARFEDEEALPEIRETFSLSGCVLLQTCNRVELYASGVREGHVGRLRELVDEEAWVKRGRDAVEHLFRVACGLESMMVGEQEILRQ